LSLLISATVERLISSSLGSLREEEALDVLSFWGCDWVGRLCRASEMRECSERVKVSDGWTSERMRLLMSVCERGCTDVSIRRMIAVTHLLIFLPWEDAMYRWRSC